MSSGSRITGISGKNTFPVVNPTFTNALEDIVPNPVVDEVLISIPF